LAFTFLLIFSNLAFIDLGNNQGSGFRVQGSGFRVQGSGFRVKGSRLMVDGIVKSRFKDWIPAFAGMTPVVSI